MNFKLSDVYKKFGIFLILLFLIIAFSLLTPQFLNVTNLINVLKQVSVLGIVCMGTMIVMCAGGMDISVGGTVALTGVLTAYLMVNMNFSPVLASLIGIVLGGLLGAMNGVIGVKLNVHPLIITLASMQIFRGAAYIICGGWPINGLPDSFVTLGQGYVGIIPIPVIIFFAVTIVVAFVLNKTVFGRYVYAIGGNEKATRLAGVNIKKMKVIFYMLSGLAAGVAGVIMCARLNSGLPDSGTGYEFDVMTAAILGGVSIQGGEGKVFSVFAGIFVMGILNNGMVLLNMSDYYQNIIKGLILLLAVAIDSRQHVESKPKRISKVQEEHAQVN